MEGGFKHNETEITEGSKGAFTQSRHERRRARTEWRLGRVPRLPGADKSCEELNDTCETKRLFRDEADQAGRNSRERKASEESELRKTSGRQTGVICALTWTGTETHGFA